MTAKSKSICPILSFLQVSHPSTVSITLSLNILLINEMISSLLTYVCCVCSEYINNSDLKKDERFFSPIILWAVLEVNLESDTILPKIEGLKTNYSQEAMK